MIRTLAVSEAKQDCARLSLATNAVAVNKTMRPAVFIKATVKLDCTWMPTYILPRDEQDPQPRQTPTSDSGCGQEARCTPAQFCRESHHPRRRTQDAPRREP